MLKTETSARHYLVIVIVVHASAGVCNTSHRCTRRWSGLGLENNIAPYHMISTSGSISWRGDIGLYWILFTLDVEAFGDGNYNTDTGAIMKIPITTHHHHRPNGEQADRCQKNENVFWSAERNSDILNTIYKTFSDCKCISGLQNRIE